MDIIADIRLELERIIDTIARDMVEGVSDEDYKRLKARVRGIKEALEVIDEVSGKEEPDDGFTEVSKE